MGLRRALLVLLIANLDHIDHLDVEIAELDKRLQRLSKDDGTSNRLTMPGIGPITAAALEAFAPPMTTFKRGRDFAAWLGLVPRQHTTGGKPRLGRMSKMGQRDIRRLLIIGAMAVVRWAARKGAAKGSWLGQMMAKKPRLLVAIALANKMARSDWSRPGKAVGVNELRARKSELHLVCVSPYRPAAAALRGLTHDCSPIIAGSVQKISCTDGDIHT